MISFGFKGNGTTVELTSHLREGCHFVVRSFDSAFNDGDKVRQGDIIELVHVEGDGRASRELTMGRYCSIKQTNKQPPNKKNTNTPKQTK